MAETAETKEFAWQGREFAFGVAAETETGMLKKGTFHEPEHLSQFVVYSDEGVRIGGTNTAPTPIGYFLLGAAFCTLTQLTRYGETMKVPVKTAKVTVNARFRTDGSVLQGTVKGSTVAFDMDIDVESDAPPERVAALVHNAEGGCFVMQAVKNPTEVATTVRLNGRPLAIEG